MQGPHSPSAACLSAPAGGFCIWQQPVCFAPGERGASPPLPALTGMKRITAMSARKFRSSEMVQRVAGSGGVVKPGEVRPQRQGGVFSPSAKKRSYRCPQNPLETRSAPLAALVGGFLFK